MKNNDIQLDDGVFKKNMDHFFFGFSAPMGVL